MCVYNATQLYNNLGGIQQKQSCNLIKINHPNIPRDTEGNQERQDLPHTLGLDLQTSFWTQFRWKSETYLGQDGIPTYHEGLKSLQRGSLKVSPSTPSNQKRLNNSILPFAVLYFWVVSRLSLLYTLGCTC